MKQLTITLSFLFCLFCAEVFPQKVTYKENTRKVTSIGESVCAAVPIGVWTMPEPTGLEFTKFTTDGERYILYNPTAKMFFASGNGWNTMASLRTFGMEIWVTESAETDAPEGSYELWDNNVNNPARSTGELNMCTDDGNSTWVDHGTQSNYSWGVEVKDGNVRFQNVALIADNSKYKGMYLGFDGTFVVANNSASDSNHRDAYTAILRHVDPSAKGVGVDFKAVTIDSYEAFVESDDYAAYQAGVNTYLASIGLKEAIESAEAVNVDVTDALAIYSDKSSSEKEMANAATALNEIIEVKSKLKAAIEEYEGKGFTGTADAKAILNNPKATKAEVEKANEDLDAAVIDWGKNHASVENPADMTSKIVNPHFDNGDCKTGWSGTEFARGGTVSDGADHYNKNYDTYQTITGLAPGVYAVGVNGYYRAGNYGGDAENHWLANDDASKYAKLYAKVGENTFDTPIANVMSGAQAEAQGVGDVEVTYQDADGNDVIVYSPNNMAAGDYFFHNLRQYANKLYVIVDETGELTIGVKKTSRINGDWSMFDDFSLTYYGSGADAVKLYLDETTPKIYKLTYMVDGQLYSTFSYDYGAAITPLAAPTKEGYTFSGWSNIPTTMPANDVTVTGTFSKNSYRLTYMVDGQVYKTLNYEYGAAVATVATPTKEGYTFSGWSNIFLTMPARDVTITGSFIKTTPTIYKLTYMVDGEIYSTFSYEYGTTITPLAAPTKDGCTFSGWSTIPTTMPNHDVTVTGTFTKDKYTLTYMVNGVVYKTISYDYGEKITPEPEPTRDGATFSGWSWIPSKMPDEDVIVTGTFDVEMFKLTYKVDGVEYKTIELEAGAKITPEPAPTKEGYDFSGWSWIPSKMPDEDVTITGTFTPTTGIDAVIGNGKPFDVYSTTGVLLRRQVTTLKGLPAGFYIVNGKKVHMKAQ